MSDRKRFGTWLFYPFLFAAHPVLALLLNNVSKVPLEDVTRSLLVVEGLTLLVLLGGRLVCGRLERDRLERSRWRRVAIYTFLVVIWILFFQRFDEALKALFGDGLNVWIMAGLWTGLLMLVGRIVWRSDSDLKTATTALNAAAILFLAVPVLTAPAEGAMPDIWYIVLDRYARADVLKAKYDFDNRPFLYALSGHGFQVLNQSTANYQRTAHSVASTLNLGYLNPASKLTGQKSSDWVLLYRLLEDNKVWRSLKQLGYVYEHFGSWWTPTAWNKHADRNFDSNVVPTFERFLWGHSLPGRLAKAAGWGRMDYRRLQCERANNKFDRLKSLASENSAPRFVFAHFLMPHPPYVLKADGRCLGLDEARARSRRDNYIDQVRYTNRQLLDLAEAIRTRSDRPSIIIFQADEGPWPERIAGDEHNVGMDTTPVKWQTLSDQELLEKQAIFHAIYLPDSIARTTLSPHMTPVNTFRYIFRNWFNANLPVLSDENHIYLDNSRVLGFQDVTDRLR
jgi:hypothetical protein